MFWLYVLSVAATELLILLSNSIAGVVLYALLLASLVTHSALARTSERQQFARALLLLPLMRILALALPLAVFPPLARYPIVGLPLLAAAWIVIRKSKLARADLGLQAGHLLRQLMLAGAGFGIGAIEYVVFPRSLDINSSSRIILIVSLSFLVFVGVIEEFIFRGVLQRLAIAALGRAALVYVSLLSAALYIGYRSPGQVIFAFGVALCFASAARWSKSIVGVALAHVLSNITLYFLMPFSASNPASVAARLMPWFSEIGITLAVGAFSLLLIRRARNGVPIDQEHLVAEAAAVVDLDDSSTSDILPSVGMYNHVSSTGSKACSKRVRRTLKKDERDVPDALPGGK